MELMQFFKIVKKRVRLILVFIVIGTAAASIYSIFLTPPVYEASTKLIVNKSDNGLPVGGGLDLSSINSNIQLIKTYKEIIRTPRIMDEAVQAYPELKTTAKELIRKVSVNAVNETQVMTVSVRDGSYPRAVKMVNAVSEVFEKEIPKLMKVDNVSVLNRADAKETPEPVGPHTKLNIAISFVLSLLLGAGFAVLLELMDDTVKSEEDIRQLLDLPTLTLIPRMKEADYRSKESKNTVAVERGKPNVTFEA